MQTIKINGEEYPCYVTMGAFVDFKNETGREASGISSLDLSDMVVFLWCCVRSACRAKKKEFPYSLQEFADAADPAGLNEFYAQQAEEDSKKKEQTGSLKG